MGRTKLIESPEKLESLFNEYVKWAEENPYLVQDFVGKDAQEVKRKKQRPITWLGFENWLHLNGVLSQLTHYEQNTGGSYTDYLPIIRVCKMRCSQDIRDGALVGIYQQNIAARLEGLKEQTDLTTGGEKISPVITAMVDGKIIDGEMK